MAAEGRVLPPPPLSRAPPRETPPPPCDHVAPAAALDPMGGPSEPASAARGRPFIPLQTFCHHSQWLPADAAAAESQAPFDTVSLPPRRVESRAAARGEGRVPRHIVTRTLRVSPLRESRLRWGGCAAQEAEAVRTEAAAVLQSNETNAAEMNAAQAAVRHTAPPRPARHSPGAALQTCRPRLPDAEAVLQLPLGRREPPVGHTCNGT